jgi:hypothetical protein
MDDGWFDMTNPEDLARFEAADPNAEPITLRAYLARKRAPRPVARPAAHDVTPATPAPNRPID